MRIAHIVPSISRQGAGVSEVARLTATAVSEISGTEIEVYTLLDKYYQEDLSNWEGIPVHGFPFFGPSNYGFSPELGAQLRRKEFDLVHVHGLWMYHCLAALQWADATSGKYVLTPHGMLDPWIMKRSPSKKFIVSSLYQDRFVKTASSIHALTEKEASHFSTMYGSIPTAVIPNYALPTPVIDLSLKPSWYRPEFEGRDIYIFLSRIHEKKGCLELLEAWDKQCANDAEFQKSSVLIFCGWIDGLTGFDRQVESVTARHTNVYYVGPQFGDDKHRSYAVADFMILPSKSEGLPVAVLEAWSAGTVVIMTDECNLKEAFVRGAAVRIGLTVPDIIQGLNIVTKMSAEKRAQIVEAGHLLIEEKYSKQVVSTAFIDLYKSVLVQ